MKDYIDDANKLIKISKINNANISDSLMKFIDINKEYIEIASYGSTIATCLLIEKIIESGMIDEIREIII
jgi:hypothetical protein